MKWGTVPDYFIVLSVLLAAATLVLQRRWERERDIAERNRQARLKDLQQAWAALAPLAALPGGFDDDHLAQPFAAAIRQLQLSSSEEVLSVLGEVTSTLLEQGQTGAAMSVNLIPLIDAVRNDYRSLMDLEPTGQTYEPFFIMSRDLAAQLSELAQANDTAPPNPPGVGEPT